MTDVILNTPSYDSIIRCGNGVFEKYAGCLNGRKFIVTDSNVYLIYKDLIEKMYEENA